MKEELGRILSQVRDIAARHGGHVEKYLGDGALVVFGADVSHPNDSERALRTAAECVEAMAQSPVGGVPIAIRVGVESGEVLAEVSPTGNEQEHMLVGSCVNTAARLEHVSEPGQILVGPTCHAATMEIAEFESLDSLYLKGLGEVAAWRLTRVLEAHPAIHPPFVGRSTELERIRSAYRRAIEGRATLLVVVGPPGQGKSRLAEEFLEGLGSEVGVLKARCRPDDEVGSRLPLTQLLADDVPEPTPEAVAGRLGQLIEDETERERVGESLMHSAGLAAIPRLIPLSASAREEEFARCWSRYFAALTKERPLVLWVEDLHWAEPNILRLFDRVSEASTSRLLVLATARPEITGSVGLRPSADHLLIELGPLDQEATVSLARSVGTKVDSAVERAAGNPLFIIELARSPSARGQLPVTVLGAIGARLDELPRADRDALQRAAVVGEAFTVRDAALLTSRDPADVAGALARLAHLGYLVPDDGHYRFHHALVRDVAYGRLSVPDRLRLHAQYAREGVTSEDVEIRAHHLWEAVGQPESEWVWKDEPGLSEMRHNAVQVMLASARRHSGRAAFERATQLCDRGFALASGPNELSEVHEVRATLHSARGDGDSAWDEWRQALQSFKSAGVKPPPRLYAEMVRIPTFNWGTLRKLPERSELLALYEEGIQAATESRDALTQAGLLTQRAFFTRDVTDLPEVLRLIDSAPNVAAYADVLEHMATTQLIAGRVDEAKATCQRIDKLIAGGATINEAEAMLWRSVVDFNGGRLAEAGECAARLQSLSAKGSMHLKTHAQGTDALVRSAAGDWTATRSLATEAERTVASNPHLGFCLVGAAAVAWGCVADVLAGGSVSESSDLMVKRMVPESESVQASTLLLPYALMGRGEHLELALASYNPSAGLWDSQIWDPFGVNLLIALTVLERWEELREPLELCGRVNAAGGRLLGAVAEAVREEMAAARGGPAPLHSSLLQLGYPGLSQLLSYRPVAR